MRVILPPAAEFARHTGKPFGALSEQVKRLLGIICLVLALVGGYRIAKVLVTGEGAARTTGNSAYDAGHRAGMAAVPVVYALFGFWLITHSDVRVFSRRDSPSPASLLTRGITFSVTLFATLMVGWISVLIVQRYLNPPESRAAPANRFPVQPQPEARSRFPVPNPGSWPTAPPPHMGPQGPRGSRPPFARPGEPGTGGIFSLGDRVEALWAGRWRPGTVTDLRGLTVFVRFDDSAMPPQMWTLTNQVRMKR